MRRPLSAHPALSGLDQEQLAELALVGLRYRALGAQPFDLRDRNLLSPYWTAQRLLDEAVEQALVRTGGSLAEAYHLRTTGMVSTLFNVGLISWDTYIKQWRSVEQLLPWSGQ